MKKLFIIILILLTGCSNEQLVFNNYGDSYSFGNRDKKDIYLTFDDGYSYENCKKIVDILEEYNVKATFFLEGQFLVDNSMLVKRMVDNNHDLGNHTFSHTPITKLTNNQIATEFKKYEDIYYNITNQELKKYFRPPEGKFTNEKLEYIHSLGYKTFFWTVNYLDWDIFNERGAIYAYNYITQNTTNGDIILMHTKTTSNVEALPNILTYFLEKGFSFQLFDNLIEERENIL